MKKTFITIITTISLMGLSSVTGFSQKKIPGKPFVQNKILKTAADPNASLIDIGNITSWVTQDGSYPAMVYAGSWNGSFPKGFSGGVIYSEGIVWGGLVNDGQPPTVRVGGNTYYPGTTALTRIVRVRPDYKTADLSDDAANFFQEMSSQVTAAQVQQIYDQYDKDWQEWPASLGAPYTDANNNGVYDPSVDIPGVPGASQTIFISYDDRSSAQAYGSPPIGLKVNETIWGYSTTGPLENTIFKKVDLIYEGTAGSVSNSQIDSMYIVQWADPDVGFYSDDYAGCDSTLNLGYAYNSTSNDAIYSLNPPAAGYVMLQGVSQFTGNSSDSAMFNFKWRHGYKYVNRKPLSTFDYFGLAWPQPQGVSYTGTLQWFSTMKGYIPNPYPTLSPFPSPSGSVGGDGTYLLPGDPVAGTGWIDGVIENSADRQICNISGPFTLKLGDTVEIATAEIGAMYNGTSPDPNLLSVEKLKQSTSVITKFFNYGTAAIINSSDFANINTPINLSADIYPSDAQPSSTGWSITSKPAGSSAQLSSTQGLSTTFTPDVIGDYEVTFDANVNGIAVSDAKIIQAISNHAPAASITLDKTKITWGDSVLIDYGGTFDLDNDTLTYVFNGSGIFNNDKANKKAYFIPYPWDLGTVQISMKAYDSYSYDSTAAQINIDPKLDQMKINYSYMDTNWILNSQNGLKGILYFKGSDTLYVPLTNSLRRYVINNSNIQPVEDNTQIKIDGIWTIKDNLLYAATARDSIASFWGTVGKLSIYDLSNGGSSVLSGYLPGSTAIMKLIQVDSEIYLMDQSNYFYKMDFSTPSSPQIIHSTQFNTNAVFYWKSDANYLYFLVRNISTSSYSMEKLNRSDLTQASSTDLPIAYNMSITFKDNTLATYNFLSDTLALYNYDGINAPALLDKIIIPSLLSNPYPDYYNSSNSYLGVGMMDSLLIIYKYSGVIIYDIGDLANIKYVGAWYGGGGWYGSSVSLKKAGSNYFITNSDPRYNSLDNLYSGLNNVTLDYLTDVKSNNSTKRIPVSYNLYQNYPNPFNPSTMIRYEIPKESFVSLKIYDVLGREVKTLVNEDKPAGSYEINFNAASLSSGIYFYRIKAGSFVQTKKLMLLK